MSCSPDQASYVLSRFPKVRPELPEGYRRRYVADYRENRYGRRGVLRCAAALEAWMHREVARAGAGARVLELGAGTLNHLPYERPEDCYEVVEPFRELWADSPHRLQVSRFYDDIREIDPAQRYDRIISVAVLEHLTELPEVLARSGLLLSREGAFAAGIPSEGALAWFLAWRFGTGIPYRLRTGLSYAPLMRHEHVNRAAEIQQLVRHFFRRLSLRRFPLPLFHASFYTVMVASDADRRLCEAYLNL